MASLKLLFEEIGGDYLSLIIPRYITCVTTEFANFARKKKAKPYYETTSTTDL